MAGGATSAGPHYREERRLRRAGFRRVAGIDEAGRGPLAGPVVAAAVVLDPAKIPEGINDSKVLLPERREELFEAICATADVAVAFASVALIDRINIRSATFVAMRRALCALPEPADAVLIDGKDLPPGVTVMCRAIVGGDGSSLSVAAASIVAKVVRDRLMRRCDPAYPGYGLASHKGYSTPGHKRAILTLGPCSIHRRSFAPVGEWTAEA
ncbi:MAG TPA: ribonuclease HII [Afifellaceae bacterium]|nr:ribonuclease HII [Afifellaceae bacterium]